MIRVRDLAQSLSFYSRHFGMTHLKTTEHPGHTDYHLATLGPSEKSSFHGVTLVLSHPKSWNSASPQPNNGNVEPNRGFGHIAFNVVDVYKFCENLEAQGVSFKKKVFLFHILNKK
jgi:lactoylglutathione lyase